MEVCISNVVKAQIISRDGRALYETYPFCDNATSFKYKVRDMRQAIDLALLSACHNMGADVYLLREEMVDKIDLVLRDDSKVSFYDVKLTDN